MVTREIPYDFVFYTKIALNCAKIHRSKVALDSIDRNFRERIPYELQAPKIAYIWPIENVWAIENQNLDEKVFHNIAELRAGIRASWCRVSNNKTLCKDLISSIPKRLKAVIKKKGNLTRSPRRTTAKYYKL